MFQVFNLSKEMECIYSLFAPPKTQGTHLWPQRVEILFYATSCPPTLLLEDETELYKSYNVKMQILPVFKYQMNKQEYISQGTLGTVSLYRIMYRLWQLALTERQ